MSTREGPEQARLDVAGGPVVADAKAEFERLATEWKRETAHLSSPDAIGGHRAYQEIIGMGKEAIPFILRDLQDSRAQWFWALLSIAGESPVRAEDRGDVLAMTDAWLNWGKDRRIYLTSTDCTTCFPPSATSGQRAHKTSGTTALRGLLVRPPAGGGPETTPFGRQTFPRMTTSPPSSQPSGRWGTSRALTVPWKVDSRKSQSTGLRLEFSTWPDSSAPAGGPAKLGGLEDIEHDSPAELEGAEYGRVVQYLRRPS